MSFPPKTAAPFDTGVAALILSLNPNLLPYQVIDIIINNADTIPAYSGWDDFDEQVVLRLNAY